MSKDDSDFYRYLKNPNPSGYTATDLVTGLESRRLGNRKNYEKSAESLELYAEEQFIRKPAYNEMRCEMPGLPRSTFLMVFSPDGSRVASTHGNHNINITDVRTGKHIRTLVGHPRTPWCIAFHPTSNQIIASGCLGGQVRIWDLSGGSEVWTTYNQAVIASLAFHPTDRVLVIATCNEVYFWDWSQPEPFVHVATGNPKEKVRFVAFDTLGHKLITGISNSPQTRWERVRAPVPVPRQERSVNLYRRRITPRLQTQLNYTPPESNNNNNSTNTSTTRENLLLMPERERRITTCYRNLVREYEQLVQRYLQLYRPPIMIDRGTDPMEPSVQNESQPEPSTSSTTTIQPTISPIQASTSSINMDQPGTSAEKPEPSTSSNSNLEQPSTSSGAGSILPSNQRTIRPMFESSSDSDSDADSEMNSSTRAVNGDSSSGSSPKVSSLLTANRIFSALNKASMLINNSQVQVPRKHKSEGSKNEPKGKRLKKSGAASKSVIIDFSASSRNNNNNGQNEVAPSPSTSGVQRPSTSTQTNSVEQILYNIRRTAEEDVQNRILPIIWSVPATDRPELIRLFEHSRKHVHARYRNMFPVVVKKTNKRTINVVDTTSDSTSSDEEPRRSINQLTRDIALGIHNFNMSITGGDNNNSGGGNEHLTVRNFNTELEQLVTTLLTEIERNESNESNANLNLASADNGSDNNVNTETSARTQEPPPIASTSASNTAVYPRPFQGYFPRFNLARTTTDNTTTFETPSNNNNNSNNEDLRGAYSARRRRFFSHRISAFMPTRLAQARTQNNLRRVVNSWNRRRSGVTRSFQSSNTFGIDELINYSERENFEDDTVPQQPLDLSNTNHPNGGESSNNSNMNMYSNIRLGNIYSNIVQDLESSLSDVLRMRASDRPGVTSDMLGSFSERLENIMTQSDMILRNLSHSMEILNTEATSAHRSEPTWSFFDQNFYVRDQRNNDVSNNNDDTVNLSDIFNRASFSAVASDHTYPRNPDGANSQRGEGVSPLMTSLHMTIRHIQGQARLLRRQVESIERIDRAMVEVAQLQLIRQLIIELVRHVRNLSGENRSAGMSSVRQMMAGTRISDNNPNDDAQAGASSSTSNASTSTVNSNELGASTRSRTSGRKTYLPGRYLRLSRQCRKPPILHLFSRRFAYRNERLQRQNTPSRASTTGRSPYITLRHNSTMYTLINNFTLEEMSRHLQHLLIEQVRLFTSRGVSSPVRNSPGMERVVVSILQDCILRINNVTGSNLNPESVRNLTVTPDGESRRHVRYTLTTIINGLTRHIGELQDSALSNEIQQQFHAVLVMSLLLTELQLLVIVESIPPPSGANLLPERASLTSRIDQMCHQMLQSRNFSQSLQLTRSLRLMKLTMRHAHSALGQTYRARRNEILPRINTSRQQVLGNINRCLRHITQQRETASDIQEETALPTSDRANNEWYSNIYDFFLRRYPNNNREEDMDSQPSTSRNIGEPTNNNINLNSNRQGLNDNTDEDDDNDNNNGNVNNNNYVTNAGGSYRNSSVNPVTSRPWNVPSVHVNDVPVSEPTTIRQRVVLHPEQNYLDRVAEFAPTRMNLFRPRFLHPFYANITNPFDADLDDPQREPVYDNDMITTVTPNHRIQAWDVSDWTVPVPEIHDALKNVVVSECKIHNDASVDVAKDGTILVTLLPSGGYLNVTNRLGVYSLRWETLGQCLYTTSFEQNAVSVSLSPLSRHLVVGLTHKIISSDRWIMARVFKIEQKDVPGDRLPVLKELEQNRENRINCIRWLPTSGQGLIYATNTGQLVVLS